MKIVINRCYGGFSLSNKAVSRLAELNGKKAYHFNRDYTNKKTTYIPIKNEDDKSMFADTFSVPNPNDFTEKELWDKYYITCRPDDRTDRLLIQVIEELGKDANGSCAKLEVIEIPDGVEYYIDDYDGIENIHESHRSW